MYKRVENAADKEKNTQRNLRKSRPFWQDIDFLFIPYYNHNEILMENIGLPKAPWSIKRRGISPPFFVARNCFLARTVSVCVGHGGAHCIWSKTQQRRKSA